MKKPSLSAKPSIWKRACILVLAFCLALSSPALRTLAGEAEPEEKTEEPAFAGWPAAPFVQAPAAILVEMDSGAVLYGKKIHEKHFPASITKLLTGLIAYENLDLEDTLTPTEDCFSDLPWDSSMAGFDIGQTYTVKEALYGLMISSGNDAANALGQKIAGSLKAFPDLMNQRARELGCVDSHFAHAHGIHNADHYTSVYDMAQIARAYFSYEDLCRIAGTQTYTIPAAESHPEDLKLTSHNKLILKEISLEGLVGSKTGYTDMARETLATCAERDGLRLICIVMRDEPDDHYTDTVNLLNYGFEHFKKTAVSGIQTDLISTEERFMTRGEDLLGTSESPLVLDPAASVVIPSDGNEKFITAEMGGDEEIHVNIRNALKKSREARIREETDGEETEKPQEAEAEEQEKEEEEEAPAEEADSRVMGSIRYLYGANTVGYADVIYVSGSEENKKNEALAGEKNGIIHVGRSGSVYIYLPGFLIGISVITLILIVVLMIRDHKKYLIRKAAWEKKREERRKLRKAQKAPSSDKAQRKQK